MKDKKIIITTSIILGVLVLVLGVSYALFTFSKTSSNSKLIVGDIYMHYNETNQIQMENAMPTNPYTTVNPIMATQEYTEGGTNELSKCVDVLVDSDAGVSEDQALSLCKGNALNGLTLQQVYENGGLDEFNLTDTFIKENIITINSTIPYFEFTIDGKNTYDKKDIYYEIMLGLGDDVDGKTTRIKNDLLKFILTRETSDGSFEKLIDGESYSDLNNKRIYVETIPKNTLNEIKHTYRLYMWVSDTTKICGGDLTTNCDYTLDDWKDVFASIKINVYGDFNEKKLATDASCFKVSENNDGTLTIKDFYKYNVNSATPEELNTNCDITDVIIPERINNKTVTTIGSDAFYKNQLTSVVIPDSVKTIERYAFSRNELTNVILSNSITIIGDSAFEDNQLTSVVIPDGVIKISQYAFYENQLTSVVIPDSVIEIGDSAFSRNELTNIVLSNSLTTISRAAFSSNQLTSIEIPNSVIEIGDSAFVRNQLTSLIIPDGVKKIGAYAFIGNKLTNIVLSNSVNSIGAWAFEKNQLTSITIGSGIQYIASAAFYKEDTSNPNLSKITINKTCSDIKNIISSNTSTDKYYPWLYNIEPYTATGVTIYGSNDEVCDTF